MNKLIRAGALILIILFSINMYTEAKAANLDVSHEWVADLRDSIPYLEKEVETHPDNYRLRFVLGTLYLKLGTIDWSTQKATVSDENLLLMEKAEKEFKEVLKIKKDESMAYYYLGHTAMQKSGDTKQAIEYYKKALETDDHNEGAYKRLSILYLAEKENYSDAIALLEKAKSFCKNDAAVYHRLAIAYMFTASYDKVIDNAKVALSLQKNVQTQLVLAVAYSQTKKYAAAQEELEDILKTDPKNKSALLGLSVVFDKMGKKEKAMEILKKAQEYYPEDSEVKKQLKEINGEK